MARTTTLLIPSLLLVSVAAFAQQPPPQTPEDAYTSRELIAWSQLQTPEPVPQPLSPKDKQIPQPEQPQDQQSKLPSDPHIEQKPIRSDKGKGAQHNTNNVETLETPWEQNRSR
jgi:hypothetical protein